METRLLLLAAFAALFIGGGASAQIIPDEFDFLEEWEILSEEVRLGEVELTENGLPPGYGTEVSRPTEQGLFKVSVSPRRDPAPFNKIHTWLVQIETPEGKPVTGAELKFYGGMPLHNHGFPTEPRFTREIKPGIYALEGIKFSMTGWWTLAMGIITDDRKDRVSFNLIVEP